MRARAAVHCMHVVRSFSSGSALNTAETTAKLAGDLCRTPVLFRADSVRDVGAFMQQSLSCAQGTRCVVVASQTGGKRAAILMHFLRKAGMFPLMFELPDGAPLTAHVAAVVVAAKRTGAQMVVGFGSTAPISVGRAAAALLSNAGRPEDFLPAAGGKSSLRAPSLPFLAVPTCPGLLELTRESLLLAQGRTLGSMRSHPSSVQACLVDPLLSSSLCGEPSLSLALCTLSHAVEAFGRVEEGGGGRGREVAWYGVREAAMGLVPAMGDARDPGRSAGMSHLLASSLTTSASLALGPLGPARGLALNVAARFSIPYSNALAALAPHVLTALSCNVLTHAEEVSEGWRVARAGKGGKREGGVKEEGGWEEEDTMSPAEKGKARGAPSPFARKSGAGVLKRGATPRAPSMESGGDSNSNSNSSSSSSSSKEDKEDKEADARLDTLLHSYAEAAEEERVAAEAEEDGFHPEDDDMVHCARRWAQVGAALRGAAAVAGGEQVMVMPTWEEVQRAGRGALSESERKDLEELGPTLSVLVSRATERAGLPSPPRLADFGLSEADLGAVAAGAEVDEHTLTSLVKMRRADLLELLRQA